jgi:vacuolar-type H+-ATPase subunit B/Vma2
MVPNQNLIVINGEILLQNYDPSFLKFIEAHEVAHIILGHDKDRNDDDEIDADLGAYILLRSKGKDDAVELLQKNYEDRHKTKFDEKRVEKLKNYFSR